MLKKLGGDYCLILLVCVGAVTTIFLILMFRHLRNRDHIVHDGDHHAGLIVSIECVRLRKFAIVTIDGKGNVVAHLPRFTDWEKGNCVEISEYNGRFFILKRRESLGWV